MHSLATEASRISEETGISEAVALEEVIDAAEELLPNASVQQFIPLLAGRLAEEHLKAALVVGDQPSNDGDRE